MRSRGLCGLGGGGGHCWFPCPRSGLQACMRERDDPTINQTNNQSINFPVDAVIVDIEQCHFPLSLAYDVLPVDIITVVDRW